MSPSPWSSEQLSLSPFHSCSNAPLPGPLHLPKHSQPLFTAHHSSALSIGNLFLSNCNKASTHTLTPCQSMRHPYFHDPARDLKTTAPCPSPSVQRPSLLSRPSPFHSRPPHCASSSPFITLYTFLLFQILRIKILRTFFIKGFIAGSSRYCVNCCFLDDPTQHGPLFILLHCTHLRF